MKHIGFLITVGCLSWCLMIFLALKSPVWLEYSHTNFHTLKVCTAYVYSIFCFLPTFGTSGSESTCQCSRLKRIRFNLCIRKIPWRRKWQPSPVFLPLSPWMGETDGLQFMVSQRVSHWVTEHTHVILYLKCVSSRHQAVVCFKNPAW